MNKFLKTKDNRIYIFKITERYSLHSLKMVDRYQELGTEHVCAYGHNLLKIENISQESNNIKELCEEFVGVSKFNDRPSIITERLAIKKPDERITFSGGIYGAIWTESGLRYICKLSDEDAFVPFTK